MTPAQIRLVQRSFARIEPDVEKFGALFYERLFAIAPEMRPLFRTDLKAQQSKFMKVISEVVQLQLRALISLPVTAQANGQAVLPGAFWSGKLHSAYGVKLEDFETMKLALLWAFEQVLESEFTPDLRAAWVAAYDIVVIAMRGGMESPEHEEEEPSSELQTRLAKDENTSGPGAALLRSLTGEH